MEGKEDELIGKLQKKGELFKEINRNILKNNIAMIYKIINRTTIAFILIAASLVFIQCGDRSDNRDPSSIEEDSTNVDSTNIFGGNPSPTYIKEREELVSNLEDLKEDLDERIENMDSKIEDADEPDESMVSMRDELIEDRSEVETAIENLHNSTEAAWNRLRTETENLYDRVSSKLDQW